MSGKGTARKRPLTVEEVRAHIPLTKCYIYLDNGATTPVPTPVIEAMCGYFNDYCTNIDRGSYAIAQRATEECEKARRNAAELLLRCSGDEMVFTRNLTQCSNIIAYALEHPSLDRDAKGFKYNKPLIKWKKGDNIVSTIMEHNSNLMPWIRLSHHLDLKMKYAYPVSDFLLTPEAFDKVVDKRTKFVAFQHVSNSIGTIHPVKEIIKSIREKNPDVLVYVDGSQGPGHMPVDVKDLDCDFYGYSGHKGPLGPQGTGGLYIRTGIIENMETMEVGGGIVTDVDLDAYTKRRDQSSKRFDAGTPNIEGLIGLGRAAEYVANEIGLELIDERERKLAKRLLKGLSEIPVVELYTPDIPEVGGVVTFNVKGMNCHELSLYLEDGYNILTRAGAHCCHPLIKHLGLFDSYKGNDRASFAYYNTEAEADKVIEAIQELK